MKAPSDQPLMLMELLGRRAQPQDIRAGGFWGRRDQMTPTVQRVLHRQRLTPTGTNASS